MTTKVNQDMADGSLIVSVKGFTIDTPTTGSYNIYLKAPYAFTLKGINYTIDTGDTDIAVKKNGSALDSPYAAIDVSSSSITSITSDEAFALDDRLSITFSNSNSPGLVELEFEMELL